MAFSLACDIAKTTLRIEGPDSDVTFNDVANAGAGSVIIDSLTVTGTLSPDATGVYELYGTYESKPYYRRQDGAWFIWWDQSSNYWIISTVVGVLGTSYWFKASPPTGDYDPAGTATGIATVALNTENPSFFVTEHVVNGVYQVLRNIQFGDDSNALTFYSKNEMVYFDDDYQFEIKSNATLQLGEIDGSSAKDGSSWYLGPSSNFTTLGIAGSSFYAYASKLHIRTDKVLRFYGSVTLQDVILSFTAAGGSYRRWRFRGTTSLKNVYVNNALYGMSLYVTPTTMENVRFGKIFYAMEVYSYEVTATGVEWSDKESVVAYIGNTNARLNLVNPGANLEQSDIYIASNTNAWVKEQYTCDIHVVDKDGANLQGVTVLCEDKNSNQVFSVQTGADGKIAQQTITYKKWEGTAETETEYSPHKFTFSKNGYTLLVMDNITVDARINWDIKVKFPERIRARMTNLGRLAILR